MTVTTGGPAPAGIFWQAVILRYFTLSTFATIGFALGPTAFFDLETESEVSVRPPLAFTLRTASRIDARGGSTGAAHFDLATITKMATATFQPSRVHFALSTTSSFSVSAAVKPPPVPPQMAINVAVNRASRW